MMFSYFLLLLDFAITLFFEGIPTTTSSGPPFALKLGLLRVTGIQFPLDPFMDPFPI